MTADILAAIDGTLEDWGDAMRWTPGPFPPLPPLQVDTVRQVAHDTGLDGYAAWLVVADVRQAGTDSPYAELVWPDGPESETVTFRVEIGRGMRGQRVPRIPECWRRWHRAYAAMAGYFWLPCPLCGRDFGGHEWRDIDGKPSVIYPENPREGVGICPPCTRAGRGQRRAV